MFGLKSIGGWIVRARSKKLPWLVSPPGNAGRSDPPGPNDDPATSGIKRVQRVSVTGAGEDLSDGEDVVSTFFLIRYQSVIASRTDINFARQFSRVSLARRTESNFARQFFETPSLKSGMANFAQGTAFLSIKSSSRLFCDIYCNRDLLAMCFAGLSLICVIPLFSDFFLGE